LFSINSRNSIAGYAYGAHGVG